MASQWNQLSAHLYRWEDTCNAYVVTSGHSAIAIDFGSGDMLDRLGDIGVERIEHILHTHHHRDQCQGDAEAIRRGAKVLVPEAEQDLFAHVDEHWRRREILNNYNVRQDRFSLLAPIPVDGILADLLRWRWRGIEFLILPTPGHTTGSVSLVAEIDGRKVACTGDLMHAGGKVWSLAATQWVYNAQQGVPAILYSLRQLERERPERLLPSHGPVIDDPAAEMADLRENLRALLKVRGQGLDWEEKMSRPWERVTDHLLYNSISGARSWAVLGKDGKALLIDSGYFFADIEVVSGFDRAARRTLPPPMEQLREEYGVSSIDVAIPTHYHDDHVASLSLLKRIFGTEIWAPENFTHILRDPRRFDLPCLWFDPVPVDRELPLNDSVFWQDIELRLFPLGAHTRYAAGIFFRIDGKRVFAVGDLQYDDPFLWNYVYQNEFELGDYAAAFSLLRELQPDLLISGHWEPFEVSPERLDVWTRHADELDQAHRRLLPLEEFDWGAGGRGAFIRPYQITAAPGEWTQITAHVRNPYRRDVSMSVTLVAPVGWEARPPTCEVSAPAGQWRTFTFSVRPNAGCPRHRQRVAADVTVGAKRLGQLAECLVNVTPPTD